MKSTPSTTGTSLRAPDALEEAAIPQQIRLAESDGDLEGVCLRICRLNGLAHYCVVRRTDENPDMPSWEVLISNWPDGLTGALIETLAVDPDSPSAPFHGIAGPFCLTAETTGEPPMSRLVDAGLNYTLLFRAHHLAGGEGIVCFSGDRHAASEMELMCLQFYAMLLYNRITELAIRKQGRKSGELSRRELECLRWIAKGKTSSEIGIILGLSENTINNYIVNACRKIGAVNRIHAVYLSLKMGLIS